MTATSKCSKPHLRYLRSKDTEIEVVNCGYDEGMSVIHIAEDEIAEKLPGLLTRVKAGDEVMIQTGSRPILVSQRNQEAGWTAAEALQRLANRTLTVVDQDFATDLAEVRRELNASYRSAEWD